MALNLTVPAKKLVTPVFESGQISISPTTDVGDPDGTHLPRLYQLDQNSPNPFNLSTTIRFDLPKTSNVSLELFNIIGQRVAVLSSGELPAGSHTVVWDGRIAGGAIAPSGIYFYRLRADNHSLVRKMVLLK